MNIEAVIWSERHGCWLKPPLLAGARLTRAANAAAVLDCAVVKDGELDFGEGAAICLLADGQTAFRGRVFAKRRTQPELIRLRAYDQLRYLQNRDCCVFRDFTVGEMLKRIAAENGLRVGEVADCGLRLGVRCYDNRRYLDMLAEVLREVARARGRRYFVFDEGGLLCLKSCQDMWVNILLSADCVGAYDHATSVDEGCYNRVKVIYEDKRKGKRRQFVAENGELLRRWGPLQRVSRNANADEQSYEKARELLRLGGERLETLSLRDAPGDLRVRGGSLVGVRWDLGERLLDCRALVKSAEFDFGSGEPLMSLELEV